MSLDATRRLTSSEMDSALDICRRIRPTPGIAQINRVPVIRSRPSVANPGTGSHAGDEPLRMSTAEISSALDIFRKVQKTAGAGEPSGGPDVDYGTGSYFQLSRGEGKGGKGGGKSAGTRGKTTHHAYKSERLS